MSLLSESIKLNRIIVQKQERQLDKRVTFMWVTCTSVNWDDKTMTANDEDNLKHLDIDLGERSISTKPVIGTDCLICLYQHDDTTSFLVKAEEVEMIEINTTKLQIGTDKIEINNGDNGDLINIIGLTNKLNKLVTEINAIRTSYMTHTHLVGTVASNAPTAVTKEVTNFSKDDYKDEKVTH